MQPLIAYHLLHLQSRCTGRIHELSFVLKGSRRYMSAAGADIGHSLFDHFDKSCLTRFWSNI
jgi:hypothetical protein